MSGITQKCCAILIVAVLFPCPLILPCDGVEKHIFMSQPRHRKIALHRMSDSELEAYDHPPEEKNYLKLRIYYKKSKDSSRAGKDESDDSNDSFAHAESPVWDPDAQTLYWVDVLNQEVHALDYNTLERRVRHIEHGEVNVVIPVANSSALLVGSVATVFLMEWNRPGLIPIAQLEPNKPRNVLNEAKCDALGRLWAGTKGPQQGDKVKPNWAGLYKLEPPCYTPKQELRDVTISNGMVWSLNNSVLYYIDSDTHKIEAFDYHLEKGQISNRRTILNTEHWGYSNPVPDGMTIDRDGHLWVALFFNGSILRIDPERGAVVDQYQLPVSRVTSLAWAGDRMEDLIVTTSRRNVKPHAVAARPLSGTIFVLRALGTGGVPHHKFQYRNVSCARHCLAPEASLKQYVFN